MLILIIGGKYCLLEVGGERDLTRKLEEITSFSSVTATTDFEEANIGLNGFWADNLSGRMKLLELNEIDVAVIVGIEGGLGWTLLCRWLFFTILSGGRLGRRVWNNDVLLTEEEGRRGRLVLKLKFEEVVEEKEE